MKILACAATALLLTFGAAQAQSMNKDGGKENSPGTTGAMGNVNTNGVATDPQGVKEQQGRSVESAPGTVGAAPGANTPSNQNK